jgi:hypothetical protein
LGNDRKVLFVRSGSLRTQATWNRKLLVTQKRYYTGEVEIKQHKELRGVKFLGIVNMGPNDWSKTISKAELEDSRGEYDPLPEDF